MTRIFLIPLLLLAIHHKVNAQNVNIPDANFKAYLVGNTSINTNADSEIQVSEASAFNGTINCTNLGISDLTGIEAFTSLNLLLCADNTINSIDLSNNTTLWGVNLLNNPIGSIDLSSCPLLYSLNVSNCNLTALDVTNNPDLIEVYCWDNSISSLDLSQNPNLEQLGCQNNDLTALNMTNISTSTLNYFNATNNPNLFCIEVDDVAAATSTWTNIDATANFSLNCGVVLVDSIHVQGQGDVNVINVNGGTLQMEASVFPSNADDNSITWSVMNGTGSANIDAVGVLTAITNGTVTVTATANDGSGVMGDTIVTISNQNVGINEQNAIQNISIYPNPVKNQIFIKSALEINLIEIVDAWGKTIKKCTLQNNLIDTSDLPKGIYFLKIQTENGFLRTKFIKA